MERAVHATKSFIIALALGASKELSGKYLEVDGPEVKALTGVSVSSHFGTHTSF